MAYDIGPKIGIEGETAFRKSIRDVNASLKAMGAEMKAVTSAYAAGDQSQEKLRKQSELLNRQTDVQKTKLAELSAMLEKSKVKYGETDEKTQKWQRAVNEATAELNRLDSELAENTGALRAADEASTEFAQAQRRAEEAAEQLRLEQTRLAGEVEKTSAHLQRSSESLKAVNKTALIAAAALGALALASAKVGMDFEAQMSKVEAISGATAEEMQALNDTAKEMGETTKFSATESAQALTFMGMAGWKSEQMVAGLPGIMNLAAASGEELASVSDIVTDSLTGFGLQASDSARFADVLAKASSSANTNVALMGETFKYAAPVAGALGYSIEDVAVATGLMANAGIKGQAAGTALRGMFTNLAKPTKQSSKYLDLLKVSLTDTSGEVKPLNALLVDMRGKFSKLTDAQKAEYAAGIAGKEAMSGMLALVNSSDADFNKLTKSIAGSDGAAKDMADTMEKNLKGQLTLLKSAAEGTGIAFYEKFGKQAAGAVEKLAKGVGNFSRDLSNGDLDGKMQAIAATAAGAATALIALNAALAVKDLMNFSAAARAGGTAMEAYTSATKAGALAQGALNLAQSVSPMGWIAIAAGAAATAFVTYKAMTHEATTAHEKLNVRLDEHAKALDKQIEQQEKLADIRAESVSGIDAEVDAVAGYVAELQKNIDANGKVKEGYEERAKYLAEQINKVIPNAVTVNQTERDSIYEITDAIQKQIFEKKKSMLLDAMQGEYVAALEGRVGAELELSQAKADAGVATTNLAEAEAKYAGARNEADKMLADVNIGRYKDQLNEAKTAVTEAEASVQGMQNTVDTVNAISMSKSMSEMEASASSLSDNITRNTDNNKTELAQAVSDYQTAYSQMVADTAEAWDTMSEDQKAAATKNNANMKKALDNQVIEANKGGLNIAKAMGEGAAAGSYVFPESMKGILDKSTKEMEAYGTKMPKLGGDATRGYALGMSEAQEEVNKAAVAVVTGGLDGVATTQDSNSPSKETQKLGNYFSDGLALGISDGRSKVINSAIKVAREGIKAAKKELDINSPSRVMRKEVGVMFSKGFAIGVTDGIKFAKKAATKLGDAVVSEISDLNDQLAEMQEKEREEQAKKELDDHTKAIEKKYDELGKAEEKGKQKILDDIAKLQTKWNDEQVKAEKTAAELALKERIKSLEGFKREYDSAISDIENKQQTMEDKLSDYGKLFETTKNRHGEDVLKLGDLQKDTDKIVEFGEALATLRDDKHGISDSLMSEITSMNVDDALAYTKLLLDATPKQYDEYMKGWEEKQLAAAEVAKDFYTDEFKQLKEEFVDKVPVELSGLKTEMEGIGKNSAMGLADGFWSKKSYIVSTFKSVLETALKEAKEAMEIHSPSRKWAEVGSFMAQGLGVGFTDQMHSVAKQINNSIPTGMDSSAGSTATKTAEGMVNGMAALMGANQGGGGTYIHQTFLDSRMVAESIYDPLNDVYRQRGYR